MLQAMIAYVSTIGYTRNVVVETVCLLNIRSLVECVGDTGICGLSKVANWHPDLPTNHKSIN